MCRSFAVFIVNGGFVGFESEKNFGMVSEKVTRVVGLVLPRVKTTHILWHLNKHPSGQTPVCGAEFLIEEMKKINENNFISVNNPTGISKL